MMTATACPSAEKIRALSLGQLADEPSDALFEHIRTCATCKSELETVEDNEDSLIASLRSPAADEQYSLQQQYDAEPDCKVAMAKALGALALAEQVDTTDLSDIPSRIGEYEVVEPLGRGGMGTVFLAKHTKLGRLVALKLLSSHRLADARMKERFESEMRAIGRLSHPNIVTAHDARDVDGVAVLVTEYIDGLDLGQLTSRVGQLDIHDACEIVRQIAVALEYTHQQGFVHRDVKPSNIMLSQSGEVKLLDLGLARLQFGDERAEITGTGQAMGTADYIAPEQINDSRSVDIRADIYSLGCTLFKLLTGHAPFADDRHLTAFAKMTAHVSTTPPSLSDELPEAPGALVDLLDRMLAKDRKHRPQSPADVAQELKEFSDGNDLVGLSQRAAELCEQPRSLRTSSAIEAPAGQSFFSRDVPTYVAIGSAFLGLILGLCLGILIKITLPNGEQISVNVPDKSGIEILNVPDGLDSTAGSNSADSGQAESGRGDPMVSSADPLVGERFSPLAFAVLVPDKINEAELNRAKAVLQQSEFGGVVATKVGVWYPVAEGIRAPIAAAHNGQQYALVTNERNGRITWEEINGQISTMVRAGGGRSATNIQLMFEPSLAKLMEQVSSSNLHRNLAIIFNNRIVAAPKIVSPITRNAEINGKFTHEELRYLHQSLSGGLVDPLPVPSPPASTSSGSTTSPAAPSQGGSGTPPSNVHARLDGIWRVAKVVDGGTVALNPSILLSFADDRFVIAETKKISGIGTFSVANSNGLQTIDLKDEVQRGKIMRGIYRIDPDGQLTISLNESVRGERPTDFKTNDKSRVSLELKRIVSSPNSMLEIQKVASENPELQQPLALVMASHHQTLEGVKRVREQIGVTETRNALKHIGIAFHNFNDVYRKFPGTANLLEGSRGVAKDEKIYPFSWRVAILPFIEQNELYEQYRFNEPWDSKHNLTLLDKMPEIYRSPFADEDQPASETNFLGFAHSDSALGDGVGHKPSEFRDGLSNTILVMEARCSIEWTNPSDIPADSFGLDNGVMLFEDHPIQILTADGAVQSVSRDEIEKLNKMLTRAGGETIR